MSFEGRGTRIDRVATKTTQHGTPCVEGKMVGFANKIKQAGRYDAPTATSIKEIAIGEKFEMMCGGVHELVVGNGTASVPAATAAGDRLFIKPADNVVVRTTGATGDYPLGVVVSIDSTRTPAVAKIHCDAGALNSFSPAA